MMDSSSSSEYYSEESSSDSHKDGESGSNQMFVREAASRPRNNLTLVNALQASCGESSMLSDSDTSELSYHDKL